MGIYRHYIQLEMARGRQDDDDDHHQWAPFHEEALDRLGLFHTWRQINSWARLDYTLHAILQIIIRVKTSHFDRC